MPILPKSYPKKIEYTTLSINASSTYILPEGFWILKILENTTTVYIEIWDGVSWLKVFTPSDAGTSQIKGAFIYSDGVNVRINNTDTVAHNFKAYKITNPLL